MVSWATSTFVAVWCVWPAGPMKTLPLSKTTRTTIKIMPDSDPSLLLRDNLALETDQGAVTHFTMPAPRCHE